MSGLRAEGYGAQADAVDLALLRAAMRAVVHMSDGARVRHFAWGASGMTTRDPHRSHAPLAAHRPSGR